MFATAIPAIPATDGKAEGGESSKSSKSSNSNPENLKAAQAANALGPRAPWAEFAGELVEHYQEIRQILEREVQLPALVAHEQARAAAALLAFKLKMPWAALREALGDQSLPNTNEPVDRIPYPLPHWLRLPNDSQSDKASDA
jgi:hypothetical protein